jgi:hypothetical protein
MPANNNHPDYYRYAFDILINEMALCGYATFGNYIDFGNDITLGNYLYQHNKRTNIPCQHDRTTSPTI